MVPAERLRVPIDGVEIESFKGGFVERRGSRPHEAVDILSPRNTPILAVDNGTIAKLFDSKAGGHTIYQFDATGRVAYYYAHLEKYAEGLHDGQVVKQGDVIGYVGTSGNAPPNTPHLHFAVFELDDTGRWWKGKALDPHGVQDRGVGCQGIEAGSGKADRLESVGGRRKRLPTRRLTRSAVIRR